MVPSSLPHLTVRPLILYSWILRLMGKMFEFEDTITTTQIRKKTFDIEYGERAQSIIPTTKIISTMRELAGGITCGRKTETVKSA